MSDNIRSVVIALRAQNAQFLLAMQQSTASVRAARMEIGQLGKSNSADLERVGKAGLVMGAAMAAGVALSVRAAVDWESAWAGVEKTVEGNAKQMAALEGELRGLAKTLPVTHSEIAGIAEAAGQLGIKREAVASFTKTVIDLGNTTDLSFDEAATSLAQFANIMQTSHGDFSRVGSALVALGNNGASTESQIMSMALRLAGAGSLVGATSDEVLALASSMADLGIRSELGGGAMSRTIQDIYSAVAEGGASLEGFAAVAGMVPEEFARAFGDEPVQVVDAFVRGLGRVKDEGGNVIGTLADLGIVGTQDLQVLLAMTGAGDGLTTSLKTSAEALAANTALVAEANTRYETTESKLKVARNALNDLAIGIGTTLLPALASAAGGVTGLADSLSGAPEPVRALLAFVGSLGAVFFGVGGAALIAVPKIVAFRTAIDKLAVSAPRSASALGTLATGMTRVGAAAGIAGAVAGVAWAITQVVDSMRDDPGERMGALTKSIVDFAESGKLGGEVARIVGKDFEDLGRTIEVAGSNRLAEMGKQFAAMGESDADIRQARRELEAIDQALAGLVTSGNLEAAGRLLAESGLSAEQAADAFPVWTDALAGTEAQATLASGAIEGVGAAASGAAPQVEELTEAQKALESALGSFVDPLGTYTAMVQESAQAVADSTSSGEDSWTDYAATAVVALDDLAARLEEDNRAAVEWQENLVTNAQKYGPEVAQILAEMGEEGHRLTAQMADDVTGDGQRMANALIEQATLAGSGAGQALDAEMRVMAAVGAAGGKATVEQLAAQLELGTGQVAAIAAKYGITLAAGIAPILKSLGHSDASIASLMRQDAAMANRERRFAEGGIAGPNAYALATGGEVNFAQVPAASPTALDYAA